MEFDFFISYKWDTYRPQALDLRFILAQRGYRVWIDEEQGRDDLSDHELGTFLRRAMDSCRYIIFFETHTEVLAVVGGPSVQASPSWQERELEFAQAMRVIVLYHSSLRLSFGPSGVSHPYASLDEAADLIEQAIADPERYFRPARPPSGGPGMPADGALGEARHQIAQRRVRQSQARGGEAMEGAG
jgi:hypothetical protein